MKIKLEEKRIIDFSIWNEEEIIMNFGGGMMIIVIAYQKWNVSTDGYTIKLFPSDFIQCELKI